MKQQYQPPTPAALYARVSSDRQDVDLSVAVQLRALRDYAENNGHSAVQSGQGRVTCGPL
jgi:DNA invertase Pin-like site-specific DNA recombinase